jgi:hypothetical protein
MSVHQLCRKGLQQRPGFGERCARSVEPLLFVFRSENNGHAVVNGPHQFIELRGDDRGFPSACATRPTGQLVRTAAGFLR